MLGLRPPGLEFRILCLEDHPQEVPLAQFSLYVHKGGLKPDSFHLFSLGDEDKFCLIMSNPHMVYKLAWFVQTAWNERQNVVYNK